MMEFLAANFNLPTIIVSIFVFGGTGWLLYHEHKTGGLGCCDGSCGGGGCGSHGGCTGNCKTCGGACRYFNKSLIHILVLSYPTISTP